MPLVVLILLLSPLFFGSVHTPAWLSFSALIVASGIYSFNKVPLFPAIQTLGLWCLTIAFYGTLQLCWGILFKQPLPIEGISLGLPNQIRMESTIFSFSVASVLFYTLARLDNITRLKNYIVLSGIIVSLIALSHWLNDTGRLFWLFEPSIIARGNRARWPFVNPNHLGAFLIFPFFFNLEEFFLKLTNLKESVSKELLKSQSSKLSIYLASPLLPSLFFISTKAILLLVAILASLSRGVVVPLSILSLIGVIHFSFLTGAKHKSFSLWISMLFAFTTIATLYEQKEILQERLFYGLIAAIDDLRWLMIKESLPLLYSSPIFGVGLGLWEERFFSVASSTFLGLRPEYLHSDTFQFFIETGLVGLILTSYFFYKTLNKISLFKGKSIFPELGAISFLLSSTFDFPLRVPAISWLAIASISVIIGNAVLRK